MNAGFSLAALRRSACIVMIAPFCLFACAGEYQESDEQEPPPVVQSDAGVTAAECSATGAAAICDPVGAFIGCASGACYVIKDVGSACVCDLGEVEVGGACNTTAECAPGQVCAGIEAPGVCRRTCWSSEPDCGESEVCTPIRDFPDFGYCEPA